MSALCTRSHTFLLTRAMAGNARFGCGHSRISAFSTISVCSDLITFNHDDSYSRCKEAGLDHEKANAWFNNVLEKYTFIKHTANLVNEVYGLFGFSLFGHNFVNAISKPVYAVALLPLLVPHKSEKTATAAAANSATATKNFPMTLITEISRRSFPILHPPFSIYN